jgi:hypothetical protein
MDSTKLTRIGAPELPQKGTKYSRILHHTSMYMNALYTIAGHVNKMLLQAAVVKTRVCAH